MKLNLNKLLENNRFLLILSLLIATISWFVLSVTVYPEVTTHIMDVPIEINLENTAAAEQGLSVVAGANQTTNVRISGKRQEIGLITKDDIRAVAYVADVTKAGEYELEVRFSKNNTAIPFEILTKSVKIKATFDRIVTRTLEVTAVTDKLRAADGYLMEKPIATPESVTVTGPEREIEKIDRCEVQYQEEQVLTETQTFPGTLVMYDENNAVIPSDGFTLDTTEFSISVPIYKQRTLPLEVEFRNVPSGFPMEEFNQLYKLSVTELEVEEPSNVISPLDSLTLGVVDLRSMDIGTKMVFPIELQSGYKVLDGTEEVTLELPATGLSSRYFSVSDFTITNKPAGYTLEVKTQSLPQVKIVGPSEIVEALSPMDILAEVDLTGVTVNAGAFTAPVQISLPNKGAVWAVGDYSVTVSAQAVRSGESE